MKGEIKNSKEIKNTVIMKEVSYNKKLKCVFIGSFRKHYVEMINFIEQVKVKYDVLSPQQSVIIDNNVDFVFLHSDIENAMNEEEKQVLHIESKVLKHIDDSSFVYLYNPDGYIGVSAAVEIGYAYKAGKKIFAAYQPTDTMINKCFITTIIPPEELLKGDFI